MQLFPHRLRFCWPEGDQYWSEHVDLKEVNDNTRVDGQAFKKNLRKRENCLGVLSDNLEGRGH
jgi:hypothetical protein